MSSTSPITRFQALPPTVYKYRCVDDHALSLITDGTIYFASARDFNDPFDTALGYDFEASDETKFWYVNRYLKKYRPDLDKKARRRETRKILAEATAAGPERTQVAQQLLFQRRLEQHGIFCAAGVPDDLLMWAHYADRHNGICVGLRRDVLVRAALAELLHGRIIESYRVTYQEEADRPSFFTTPRVEDWPEWHGRVVAVKSTHWAYEEEVRLVTWNGAGVTLDCGSDLVAEVVLGCRISSADEARVFNALNQAESTASVFRARVHERRFELIIESVVGSAGRATPTALKHLRL